MLRELRRDRLSMLALAALVACVGLLAWSALPRSGGPAGRLVVADLRGAALFVLELETGAIHRTDLPGAPHELVALPDGRVVASLEQSGLLAILHPASGLLELLTIGGLPHGLAASGGTLYVTDRAAGAVRRFDTSAPAVALWREQESIGAGGWPHAIQLLPHGGLAVAQAAASSVALHGIEIPVSGLPESLAVTAEGMIAVAGAEGGDLELYDRDGALRERLRLGGRPVRVIADREGGAIAVALSAAGEAVIVSSGSEARRVRVGGIPDGLAFSRDGRWLFVGDLSAGRLSVIDVARGTVRASWPVGRTAGALLLLSPSAG